MAQRLQFSVKEYNKYVDNFIDSRILKSDPLSLPLQYSSVNMKDVWL
jgi:hypothetical protein